MNQHFPQGAFNTLIGCEQLGNAIARHPEITKLSVTGSVKTGQSAMSAAARNLKRITLELGGNDPAIILPDADPLAIADPILDAAFRNAGQVCSAIKRLYIPESNKHSILNSTRVRLILESGSPPSNGITSIHSATDRLNTLFRNPIGLGTIS